MAKDRDDIIEDLMDIKFDNTDQEKEMIESILEKMERLKQLRKDLVRERGAVLKKLKVKYDKKLAQIGIDVDRYEGSAKVLVGLNKYYQYKKKFLRQFEKKLAEENKREKEEAARKKTEKKAEAQKSEEQESKENSEKEIVDEQKVHPGSEEKESEKFSQEDSEDGSDSEPEKDNI